MKTETERLSGRHGDILRARGLADRSITKYQQDTVGACVGDRYEGRSLSDAQREPANTGLPRIRRLEPAVALVLDTNVCTLGFDKACAEHFGRIRAGLTALGQPIADFDVAIAATAFAFGRVPVPCPPKTRTLG